MLNGMHAESCEGLDVSVAVMDRVDVFVQRSDVDEPVRKVEVNPSEKWNSKEGENKEEEVPRVRGHLLVGQVGKTTSGVTMEDNPFPDCVLHNSKE